MKTIKSYKIVLLPCALMLGSLSTAAHANPLGNMSNHWYIGGSLGQSNMDPDGGNSWKTDNGSDIGKKIYVGANVSPQLGLEAFWADFGDADMKSNVNTQGSVNYKAIGASVVYKPLYSIAGLRPIGKLGVAKFNNSDKGEVTSKQKNLLTIFAGIGAEYDLTHNLKLRTEYEYYDKDINHLSVGVNWSPLSAPRVIRPRPAPPPQEPKIIYVPQPTPEPIIIEKPIIVEKPVIIHQPAPKPMIIRQPAPQPPQYKTVHKTLSGGSHFASGSAQLTFDGKDALNRLAQDLRNQSLKVKSIRIIGHTDSVGSHRANRALSLNRANAVATYLASRGVNRGVINTQGMGESEAIANNKTKHGRAQNRRVEITIQGAAKEIVRS
jgi:OOP family OmpA-OmpF porin